MLREENNKTSQLQPLSKRIPARQWRCFKVLDATLVLTPNLQERETVFVGCSITDQPNTGGFL